MSQLDRGVCVVSIDMELAWGAAHRRKGSEVVSSHRFDLEREVLGKTLDIFARYDIPATWAIVGHLFLDSCEGHPEITAPDYDWLEGDWYDVDPCSSVDEAPYFYSKDIIDQIAACPVEQEIGSHSFSHLIVDDPACTPDVFASDLAAACKVAAERGIELRSFVYPRMSIDHLETLAEAGFTNYRGHRDPPFSGLAGWRRKVAVFADRVRPLSGSAVQPTSEPNGLWNLHQTYYLDPASARRRWPVPLWCQQPLARARQAARERSLFHLWFHPYNLTAAPERTLDALERICHGVARLRDESKLDVLTMSALTEQLKTGSAR